MGIAKADSGSGCSGNGAVVGRGVGKVCGEFISTSSLFRSTIEGGEGIGICIGNAVAATPFADHGGGGGGGGRDGGNHGGGTAAAVDEDDEDEADGAAAVEVFSSDFLSMASATAASAALPLIGASKFVMEKSAVDWSDIVTLFNC